MKKYLLTADPFIDREKQKYKDPIPSREYLLSCIMEKKSMDQALISKTFGLVSKKQVEALKKRLSAMCREGQLHLSEKKTYMIPVQSLAKRGVVHYVRGQYFFHVDLIKYPVLKTQYDYILSQDEAIGTVETIRDRAYIRIKSILKRHTACWLGLCHEKGKWVEIPYLKQRILIKNPQSSYQENEKVWVEIDSTCPIDLSFPEGFIQKKAEDDQASQSIEDIFVQLYQIPVNFPPIVLVESEALVDSDPLPRKDLRDLHFVTIDDVSTQDYDDAIYCSDGPPWTLFVSISDVSYFVKPHTAMDIEAAYRANSLYFPDKTIAMLPDHLSADLASLLPHKDRLCLTCEMKISEAGKLLSYVFYPSVIQSKERLTYQNALLSKKPTVKKLIKNLSRLAVVVQSYMSFLTIESANKKVVLKQQEVEDICTTPLSESHKIVETCMLLANISAAKLINESQIASIFRIHPVPEYQKIAELKQFLERFKLESPVVLLSKYAYLRKLNQLHQNSIQYPLIKNFILQTLGSAYYSSENKGHFGLNTSYYTHFTSPIRRYADLIVHRTIRHILNHDHSLWYEKEELDQIGLHCTMIEKKSEKIERQVFRAYVCQFMLKHIGKVFEGMIHYLSRRNIMISIKPYEIDGCVVVSTMKDGPYILYEADHLLRNANQKIYRLGDMVRVRIQSVQIEKQEITFLFV